VSATAEATKSLKPEALPAPDGYIVLHENAFRRSTSMQQPRSVPSPGPTSCSASTATPRRSQAPREAHGVALVVGKLEVGGLVTALEHGSKCMPC
jgi:hypothetical protein